ncbi:Rieske 2Fe-2S domain-containing protein [Streptomyces sp. NPDC055955]|uniref:aromatic ring-hydroxylating oxygenase subunit alpha n=1 Tax=Streptomyces sp. NPDC055955 TaxID=3345665 RepID=UPI0035DA4A71
MCRHRGHSICAEPKGNKRRLTCPYHAWTYDQQGKLVAAPSLDDGDYIDYAEWGLKKVHVETWQGCIFIALREPTEKALAARLDSVAPQMLPLEIEHMKQVAQSTKIMNANWKILVENYHECCHGAGNHPELSAAMDLDGMYEETDNPDRFTEFYGGGAPVQPGMVSLTKDGQPASQPLLGEYGRGRPVPDAFNAGFEIWPMLTKGLFSPCLWAPLWGVHGRGRGVDGDA